MKKNMIKITLGTWLLLVVLLASGCAPAPQNANSSQNQNANAAANANTAANANSADSAGQFSDDGTCSEGNLDQRRQKVYDKIKQKIENSSLNDQYVAGRFKFNVLKAPGSNPDSLYLYIGGKVSGKDQFGVMAGIIKNFVKAKCTSRIIFVSLAGVPLNAAKLADDPGFEWTACDYPNVPCPNGECRAPGTCPNPTPDPNVNTNSNSRPKANAK